MEIINKLLILLIVLIIIFCVIKIFTYNPSQNPSPSPSQISSQSPSPNLEQFIQLSSYPELQVLTDNIGEIKSELDNLISNGLWTNYGKIHHKDIFTNNNIDNVINELNKHTSKINIYSDTHSNTNSDTQLNPEWKIYSLIYNKQLIKENASQCPKTIKLIEQIPYVINAGFSCLEPGAITDYHSDDNKTFYRYQLPLIVPNGDTQFKLIDNIIPFEYGKPFIFDDCKKHQAWNKTNHIRIVLILDILRK